MMDRRRFLKNATLGIAASTLSAENTAAQPESSMMPLPEPFPERLPDPQTASVFPAELSLKGAWAFRSRIAPPETLFTAPVTFDKDGWTAATLPGCWEKDGQPATLTGPVWYRRDVVLPRHLPPWSTKGPGTERGGISRLWWECDAVSYHAEGHINGDKIGTHTGMWDAFAWEVPLDVLTGDGTLRLALSVEKPGGARFPLRQTMAGFLPYVWGTWGGPWQEMRLRITGPCRIENVWTTTNGAGVLDAEVELILVPTLTTSLRLTLRDAKGQTITVREVPATRTDAAKNTVKVSISVPNIERWEPERPVLYSLIVEAIIGGQVSDAQTKRIGFRTIEVFREQIRINGNAVFFRAPLSWGWYEDFRAPNPPVEIFRRELERIRALGFNGVKLCLWIPPPSYFDLADEMGMLLWVELPMWLPEASKFSREQTPAEYRRIVQQIGSHPSVLLWTIGCEIGQGIDAAFLNTLYKQVKERTQSPLVRDNSGSAECYGGPLPESADYRDYHLYCDLPFARTTLESFAPNWRERQPFLFGEFNDQDALRDLPGLIAKRETVPWWAVADKEKNPQGVRWEYSVTEQTERMKAANLLSRLEELRESSRKQALLARKHTLELVRSYPHMSGYVVTGLVDTPISTAGLFDDFGNARFTPEEFSPFNDDTVLFIEPDRRREWTAGGDRPSRLDRYGVSAGEIVRRHLGVSHFGKISGPASVTWTAFQDGREIGRGQYQIPKLQAGEITEIGVIEFTMPNAVRAERITINAALHLPDNRTVSNTWSLWGYAKPVKDTVRRIGLYDPANHLSGFAEVVGITPVPLSAAEGQPMDGKGNVGILIATEWRPTMLPFVRLGGKLLLVQSGASAEGIGSGLPAVSLPFFREAMRLFEPHESWGRFPHERTTDFNFYGIASDCAFEIEKVRTILGQEATLEPVLTRVDARSFAVHAYTAAARIGAGRMLMTTLRPQGGLGDQPSGLQRNTTGAYLLRQWLDWLSR